MNSEQWKKAFQEWQDRQYDKPLFEVRFDKKYPSSSVKKNIFQRLWGKLWKKN